MIKKIAIENYGSFKNVEINFGETYPTFVVGLNDVGKTAFLNAIWSLKNGVVEQFMLFNNRKKNKIQITLSIIKEHYNNWEEKTNFIESFGSLFVGDLTINIDNIRGQREKISFKNLKQGKIAGFIEEIILVKIRNIIQKKFKSDLNIDQLNDENIEEINNWFLQKEEQKGKNLLALFKKFKFFLAYLTTKIHFLKLTSDKEWDFIKERYSLRKDDNDELDPKIGKQKTLLDIVKVFSPDEYENFKNIISNDAGPEQINTNIKSIVKAIDDNFNGFLKKYFPSNNEIISEFYSWINTEQIHVLEWKMRDKRDEIKDEIHITVNKRSEGFKWFLKLYYTIMKAEKYDVILIDEPEKFMHIKTQEKFLEFVKKFINEKKIKFIFATHSPWIISDKKGLDILRINNICFLQKENGETKNFTFNQILKSRDNKGNKELISLINTALGFNYFEFMKLSNKNKIIFVEGDADIFLWRFVCKILKKESNYYKKFHFWPLYGDSKFWNVGLAEALNLEYKILLDGDRKMWEKRNPKIEIDSKKMIFLGDELKDQNIINPEDILNDSKKRKFDFSVKGNKHLLLWKKLFDDYQTNEEEFFDENEIKKFKYYFSVVNKIFNQNTEAKKFSILNTINEVDNNINNKTLKEEK